MSERLSPVPPLGPSLLGAFLLAAPLLYFNGLGAFFVSDDFLLLRALQDGGPLAIWFRDDAFLRPLVCLSWALDLRLWGLNPLAFHLTNVLVHALNAWLVARLARHLQGEALGLPRQFPALAGAIFLVLPCHAEAVTWISGRTDLLASFFALLCIDRYLAWHQQSGGWRLVASLAAFAAALLCKESVVILPAVLMAHGLATLSDRRARRRAAAGSAAYVGVLGAYFFVRIHILEIVTAGHFRVGLADAAENTVLHLLKTLTTYWPQSFSGLRPFLKAHKVVVSVVLLVLLLALLAMLVDRWRRAGSSGGETVRRVGFLLAAWGIALAPAVPLSTRLFTSESDRFLYLPSVFAAILTAMLLGKLLRGRRFAVASILLLVIYAGLLWRVNRNWQLAGRISHSIVEAMAIDPETSSLEVLTLPDNLAGAYVFRNGFADALALFADQRASTSIRLLSTYELFTYDDAIEVRASSGGMTLSLDHPRAVFSELPQTLSGCAVARRAESLSTLEVELGGCDDAVRLAFYQVGSMTWRRAGAFADSSKTGF